MTTESHVLPLVVRIRDQIDQVFVRYVGPIATELGHEEFEHWRTEGQVGPTALHRYISRLARYISDEPSRRKFVGDATKCIHVPNGGKR
jgi:hypothetical protein